MATAKEENISQTSHAIRLDGRDIKYTATTGTLPIRLDDGKVAARMFFVAYTKDGEDKKSRPVSFLYNGGPGSATVWLHMGSFAPRHVQMAAEGLIRLRPSAPAIGLVGAGEDTGPRSGSVYLDLEVPDFLNAPLTLSGLVLSVSPPVVSGPARALASLLPVVPTTLREFYRDEAVGAFLRVYQGAGRPIEPVTLGVRIVDSHGATIVERSETLGGERFAGARAADYQFDVPLSTLAPGPYLLTVQASARDHVVRRDVRFAAKR